MKRFLQCLAVLLLLGFTTNIGYCSDRAFYFVGSANLKPLKLKLIMKNNDLKSASVQYFGQKGRLNLAFLKEEELRRGQNHPSQFQIEWEEIVNHKKNGRYIMVSQGARVYHFIYLRYSDLKVFVFEEDETSDW